MKSSIPNEHMKHSYVPAFEGLRGIILAVIFLHLQLFYPILANHSLSKLLLYDRTWYTVDVFFCLSGFLVTWILANEMQATGTLDLIKFHKRRAVRLLPAYATAFGIATVLALIWGFSVREILHDAAFFLTYTYNVFVSVTGTNFAPAIGYFLLPVWFICIEQQFYLVWPLAFKSLKMKSALKTVCWSLILLNIYRSVLILQMMHTGHSLDEIYNRFYFGTDTRIDAILMGCAAALALQNRRYYDVARKYLKARSLPFLLPAVIAMIVFLTARRGVASLGYQVYGAEISFLILASWIVCILFQPDSLVSRVLASRPLRQIGRISYGIYIFHFLVIRVVAHALEVSGPSFSLYRNLEIWIIATIVTAAIATAHYYLIELPLRDKYKSADGGRTQPAVGLGLDSSRKPRRVNVRLLPNER
jgi:peptidoglycan/LPS O-acetylase OafA/YrhL